MNKKVQIGLAIISAAFFTVVLIVGCSSRKPDVPVTVTAEPTAMATEKVETQNTPTANPNDPKLLGPLFVNPDNRRYFTDGTMVNGKYRVIYLTGSHTWCNFTDCGYTNPPKTFDFTGYLDFLKKNNHNFIRLWRAENAVGGEISDDFWFSPLPYQRSDVCCAADGGNKFDLTKFDQSYFDRLRARIIEAGDRGIYVSIMLFDGWSVQDQRPDHHPWIGHPYNINNNVNKVDGDINKNNQGEETHVLINTPVTALQESYVKKVVDTVNDLDNVLYEISNESLGDNPDTSMMDGSRDWQYHMINFIRKYEAGKPKEHPIGMTWEWPYGNNDVLYDSPADWVSLGGNVNLNTYVPPATDGLSSSKIILADTDHLCGICGDRQWVWKSFLRGENPIFMDSYDPDFTGRGVLPGYDPNNANDVSLRKNLGYARSFAERINLVSMTPRPDICSTGYCLANPTSEGAEYVIYIPAGIEVGNILNSLGIDRRPHIYLPDDGKISVDLTGSPVELKVQWFNPSDGTYVDGGIIQGGNTQNFTSPIWGDAVLYIYDAHKP